MISEQMPMIICGVQWFAAYASQHDVQSVLTGRTKHFCDQMTSVFQSWTSATITVPKAATAQVIVPSMWEEGAGGIAAVGQGGAGESSRWSAIGQFSSRVLVI
jgi:hypothetical protein